MAKQVKVREDNYFAVQGWMVTELKLKGNALMLYAIIYGFSQTTNTAFTGSVDYLCEWLGGVSRPTVINTLDNLVKQGLLTKSSTTKGALIYNSYTALRPSKKILSDEDPTSKKTLPDTSKNFLLNKDIKDNIEKSISKEMEGKAPKKRSYSTILEDPVNKFVKEALSKFIQYCRGKNYTPRRLSLLPIININTSKDKVTRAMRRSANFENHKVYFREGMDDLEECLLLFPEVDHDDLFDALDFAMTMADGGNEIRVLKREDFRI